MSWEEDYLMAKAREFEVRFAALEAELGVDLVWDGSTYSKSTEAQPTNTSNNEASLQPPALTTGSPSKKGQTESSTVDSTDGSGTESTSEDDYDEWTKAELQEELTNRNLNSQGNKVELVKRLRLNDAES